MYLIIEKINKDDHIFNIREYNNYFAFMRDLRYVLKCGTLYSCYRAEPYNESFLELIERGDKN